MLSQQDLTSWSLAGDGVFLLEGQRHLTQGVIDVVAPDIRNLLQIADAMLAAGQVVTALDAAPLYVRETVAQKSRQ
jgi:tRNA A37 threonylcarbamoyladenosine modification protein TsaB